MEKYMERRVMHQVRLSLQARIRHFEKQTLMYPFFEDMTMKQFKRADYVRRTWIHSIISYNELFPDQKIESPFLDKIEDIEHVEGQTFMCPA